MRGKAFNRQPRRFESYLRAVGAIGAERALPSGAIMRANGIRSERLFRSQIEKERKHGALILGNRRGLFLPSPGEKGRRELRRYVRTGEARIKGQAVILRPARRALRELEGQISLGDGGENGKS